MNLIYETTVENCGNNYSLWFYKIAQKLMWGTSLYIDNVQYRICEISFHYSQKGKHEDPWIFNYEAQTVAEKWFLNDKAETVDISMGKDGSCGGILLRSICEESDFQKSNKTLGVKEIYRLFGGRESEVKGKYISDKNKIYLKKNEFYSLPVVISAPRVTLHYHNKTKRYDDDKMFEFLFKRYRYSIFPKNLIPYEKKDEHILYASHSADISPFSHFDTYEEMSCILTKFKKMKTSDRNLNIKDWDSMNPDDALELYAQWVQKFGV